MGFRDQVIKCKVEKVEVPERGLTLYMREMSGAEREVWQGATFKDGKAQPGFMQTLLLRCICDEHGKREYTDDEAALLADKPAKLITRLFLAATKINAVDETAVDDLAKNS